MHEFSLMREVVNILRASAGEEGISRIDSVTMTVGAMSCPFPPALEAAFEILCDGDPLLEQARLGIEVEGIVLCCRRCGWTGEMKEEGEFICSACGCGEVRVIRGEEITVDSYQGRKCGDGHRQVDGEGDEEQ
ncbi:MAG: hydrogenase maturation nickel metallochaperone HypA [Bacillota bacterium]